MQEKMIFIWDGKAEGAFVRVIELGTTMSGDYLRFEQKVVGSNEDYVHCEMAGFKTSIPKSFCEFRDCTDGYPICEAP
jgi:hypothetical protein